MEVWSCFSHVQDERHIDRYLKNGISKSIVLVVRHANFQLYKVHPMELFRKPRNWQQIYKQTSSIFYTSNHYVSLKFVEKKKLLGHHNKEISLKIVFAKKLFNDFKNKCGSSHQSSSVKKLFIKILQYSQENTCVGDSL